MISSGKDYHFATGYDRYRLKGHLMDWANPPALYKAYSSADSVQLPEVSSGARTSLWDLTARKHASRPGSEIDLNLLSRICLLSYCFTAKSRQAGHEFFYRSAASAGALYPCELYLATQTVKELDSGLYHYAIRNRSLSALRTGDYRYFIANAAGHQKPTDFGVWFFITGIFFRSAWKYRERAFRYVLLDTGHLLENLLIALNAVGLSFSVHYDFDDGKMGQFLGLDGKREACLACVAVQDGSSTGVDPVRKIAPLSIEIQTASIVSDREVHYDEIEALYCAGAALPEFEKKAPELIQVLGAESKEWKDIERIQPETDETTYPDAVFHRRSKRNYIDTPLSRHQFIRLLDLICSASVQDVPAGHRYASAVVTGFITGNIENTEPGFYLLDPPRRRIGLVFKDRLLVKMAAVCLDQEWLRNASVHFLFLTNLAEIDRAWGPRSYRYAMLAAGRLGQTIYLGATALGLGCCGIGALYDGEARELLGLNKKSALLYLVAAGPVKRL